MFVLKRKDRQSQLFKFSFGKGTPQYLGFQTVSQISIQNINNQNIITMKNLLYVFLACAIVGFVMCLRPPDYPIIPRIAFVKMSKNTMKQGDGLSDSLRLVLSFEDGDGDIGSNDSLNVFLTDARQANATPESFRMPFVPEQGAKNGISGEISLLVYTTCCLPTCSSPQRKDMDSLYFDVFIKDRASHKSNVVRTPLIGLKCR